MTTDKYDEQMSEVGSVAKCFTLSRVIRLLCVVCATKDPGRVDSWCIAGESDQYSQRWVDAARS